MPDEGNPRRMPPRRPLSRERIIDAAVGVADRGGLTAVTMRNVAKALGVEAMSLYHHLPSKDALLDDLVDGIYARIELPAPEEPWRAGMRARALSARKVLAAHPWALGTIESRPMPGVALLRHHNAVLGCLRGNGFSVALAARAFSVIDSYVFGFVLTEASLPFDSESHPTDFVAKVEQEWDLNDYPYLAEMIAVQVTQSTYAYADEFEFGLDLILDSLEHELAQSAS